MDKASVNKLLLSMKGTEARLDAEYLKITSAPRTANMREYNLRESRIFAINDAKKLVKEYVHKFDESVNTDWAIRQGKRISKALEGISNMTEDSRVFVQYAKYLAEPIDNESKAAKEAKSKDMSNAIVVEMSF